MDFEPLSTLKEGDLSKYFAHTNDTTFFSLLEQVDEQAPPSTGQLISSTNKKMVLGLTTLATQLPNDVFRVLSNVDGPFVIEQLLKECPSKKECFANCTTLGDLDTEYRLKKIPVNVGELVNVIAPNHNVKVPTWVCGPERAGPGRRTNALSEIKKLLTAPTTLSSLHTFMLSRDMSTCEFCRLLVLHQSHTLPSSVVRQALQICLGGYQGTEFDRLTNKNCFGVMEFETVFSDNPGNLEAIAGSLNIILDAMEVYVDVEEELSKDHESIQDLLCTCFHQVYTKLTAYCHMDNEVWTDVCAKTINLCVCCVKFALTGEEVHVDVCDLVDFNDLLLM